MPSTPRLLIATAAGLLLCAGQASANLITLSDFASNGPGAPTADVFDATMDFDVDAILNTLTLTVSNTTVAPDEFQINRIYFNGGGNVTGLSIIGAFPTGWGVRKDTHANGFGIFNFAFGAGQIDGTGTNLILPGEFIVFVFDIETSGPILKADFINTFSIPPPGPPDILMTHAAKFVRGGAGDLSGFGAVPAPGSLVLLGVAGALLTGRRRPRR